MGCAPTRKKCDSRRFHSGGLAHVHGRQRNTYLLARPCAPSKRREVDTPHATRGNRLRTRRACIQRWEEAALPVARTHKAAWRSGLVCRRRGVRRGAERRGILATTAGGATSDESADFMPLATRTVVVWPDNDQPGIDHAERVAEMLVELGCNVEIIDAKALGLPEHGDCVDWLNANPDATVADLATLPRRTNWGDTGDLGDSQRRRLLSGRRPTGDNGRLSSSQITRALEIARSKLLTQDFEPPSYPIEALGGLAEVCHAFVEGG